MPSPACSTEIGWLIGCIEVVKRDLAACGFCGPPKGHWLRYRRSDLQQNQCYCRLPDALKDCRSLMLSPQRPMKPRWGRRVGRVGLTVVLSVYRNPGFAIATCRLKDADLLTVSASNHCLRHLRRGVPLSPVGNARSCRESAFRLRRRPSRADLCHGLGSDSFISSIR